MDVHWLSEITRRVNIAPNADDGSNRLIKRENQAIPIICTGQRSAASRTQTSRSGVGWPSPIFPSSRYCSITWLNESSGFCSKKPGQVSQQEPQLTHVSRSILTFMTHSLSNGYDLPLDLMHENPLAASATLRIFRMLRYPK